MSLQVCFLDMDGVLVDFVHAIHVAHNRPYCYADPSTHGGATVEQLWGVSDAEFWKTDTYEFWAEVPVLPGAEFLVDRVCSRFGTKNVAILTSPSAGSGCVPGKRACIKKYFPMLERQMIFTKAKYFLASSHTFLIDDMDPNVDAFEAYGGNAILYPTVWNTKHTLVTKQLIDPVRHVLDVLETVYGK